MRNTLLILGFALALAACGGGNGKTITVDATDQKTADVPAEDLRVEETSAEEIPRRVEDVVDLVFDVPPEDTGGPQCQPGEGCFLDPCESNDDCLSGWCVGHMGEDVCSIQCQTECPSGWSCEQVPGTAPDVVWLCISSHANLCLPCSTGADCKGAAGADDVCVDYGKEGSYCGGACLSDEECPWGFSCGEAVTVSGISTKQCVADAGVCPCTKKSVELALFTPCEVENEFGMCEGKRVCTEDGLTECDAAAPAIEVCDGIDNDCDGDVDEPEEVGGDYVNLCNDGNPCTKDTCLGSDGCSNEPLSGIECFDGNPCTVADHCEEGECVGTQVDCDDGNPCTDDTCNPAGGCSYADNSAPCSDGDPCTVADQCSGGTCAGTSINCDCQADADCDALEDGDLCNGTLFCDLAKMPYQCKVDPDTVVTCPEPTGPDAPCLEAVCAPETGTCSLQPAKDGAPCSDGDACTVGDACDQGTCQGGVPANCKDDNPCTNDSCDSANGCFFVANDVACDDGNVCTVGDQCADGTCQPGKGTLDCDDGNPCTIDSCNPATGCAHGNSSGACDDGNLCTLNDQCVNGSCVGGPPPDCDDDNPCTKDVCQPGLGCVHNAVAGACSDGDPCTLNDQCINGACQAGPTVVCDDGNPCTVDSCDADGLCLFAPTDGACSDGNACTVGDHCEEGKCVTGGMLNCNDQNVCTNDSCDPAKGCVHLLNQAPCDDEDVCTYGDHCSLGDCIASGTLTCNDGNPCTADSCNPKSGCEFKPDDDGACSDNNACTDDDHCSGGSCLAGSLVSCDDGNLCTDDSCDPKSGCVHLFNSIPCDDGELCTIDDHCDQGLCVGGEDLDCDDGNPCTDDACDGVAGCIHTNNTVACTDGNECTGNDKCKDGACVGVALNCDDGNVCTTDACDPAKGCVHGNSNEECEDGDACTTGDTCADGACVPGGPTDCDDGDSCTEDSCDPDTGCLHTPTTPCCGNGQVEAGEECDDGNTVGGDGCSAQCTKELHAQCYQGYQVLNQNWRHVNYGNGSACDSNLSGWYRYEGAAGTKMPDTPPPVDHCNTDATGWVQNGHPSIGQGVVTRKVCFHWSGNTCWHSTSIQIVNCGNFYLYNLGNPSCCSCVYCGTN